MIRLAPELPLKGPRRPESCIRVAPMFESASISDRKISRRVTFDGQNWEKSIDGLHRDLDSE